MSKIQCKCGHVISDVACPCATEADVIGDTAYEHFDRDFTHDVASFLASTRENRRSEWIVERFGTIYPTNLPDAEVISDLLTANFRNYAVSIAECEKCGRLWLQRRVNENDYRSFIPDEGGYELHFAIVGAANGPAGGPKNATNKPMHGNGEVERYQLENRSSPPRDR